jgi:hypothetical protein
VRSIVLEIGRSGRREAVFWVTATPDFTLRAVKKRVSLSVCDVHVRPPAQSMACYWSDVLVVQPPLFHGCKADTVLILLTSHEPLLTFQVEGDDIEPVTYGESTCTIEVNVP